MSAARSTITITIAVALTVGSLTVVAAQTGEGEGASGAPASPSITPGASASSVPSGSPGAEVAGTLVMGPPKDRTRGAWTEVGRHADWERLRLLASMDDLLVAIGAVCEPNDGPCVDVGWHSSDAVTWTSTALPGERPRVTNIASSPQGLIAVGYDLVGPEMEAQAAVWATADGIEWTQLSAPPVAELDRVAASPGAIVVAGGGGLWVSADGTDWEAVEGVPGGVPVAGPGGFLASAGGGQDLIAPTRLWRSADGRAWERVRLPKPLRAATSEIELFSLGDTWLMFPGAEEMPNSILSSSDGIQWRRAPRPPGTDLGGFVRWVQDFGDQVEAHGLIANEKNGLWSWQLGKQVDKPRTLRNEVIGEPVAWQGGHLAIGQSFKGPGAVTIWRREAEAAE